MNNLSAYLLGIITAIPIFLLIAWLSWMRVKKRARHKLDIIASVFQKRVGGIDNAIVE